MVGRFDGKTVVVTGGAGGLGSAMVRAFVAEGARVVIADCDQRAAQALANALPGAAIAMELDVCDESSWVALLDRVTAQLGALDVLVNNAGFFAPNIRFEDMPLALWRKHFAINCDGVFLGCKHAILRMRPRSGGAIINLGSGMSLHAQPTASAYCGSKAAVLMTTRTAAAAAGAYGIRVNAVLPGAVHTPMLLGNLQAGESEQAFLARMASHGVLGRLAEADDIARAVLFLADPANSAITGIHLPVDGGNVH
jgi:NAD(P)-dependent dehydrogenase (short-subunit alcohol dehydrogenase family)